MKATPINSNNIEFTSSYGRKFVTGLARPGLLAPVILLEATVTGGRTYQAYKRGGFIEGRERFTEEVLGAIVWLFGVKGFNKLGNFLGKKALKLPHVNFDTGSDYMRKPFDNFMGKVVNGKYSKKFFAGFKLGKVLASILAANAVVGFVVPKVNQAITRKYQASLKNVNPEILVNTGLFNKQETMDNFIQNIKETTNEKEISDKKQPENNKKIGFKGGIDKLLSFSYKLENDVNYVLISTDCGVASGRAISARNKDERIEVLIRDLGSIYFYLWAKNHIGNLYNKIDSGRTRRIDPTSAKQVDDQLQKMFKNKNIKSIDNKNFLRLAFGKETTQIPEGLKFTDEGIIKLNDFIKFEKNKALVNRAKEMAKLQPELMQGAILNKTQVLDVYKGGLLNNPKFLNEYYSQITGGKSTNPYEFVAQKDLDRAKQDIVDYVQDFIKERKDNIVTSENLKKFNKKNFLKNSIGLGAGLAVSALFLSTIIPKVQYLITKKRTGKNEFPGIENSTNVANKSQTDKKKSI